MNAKLKILGYTVASLTVEFPGEHGVEEVERLLDRTIGGISTWWVRRGMRARRR